MLKKASENTETLVVKLRMMDTDPSCVGSALACEDWLERSDQVCVDGIHVSLTIHLKWKLER